MDNFLAFIIEHTLVNTAPIFLASGLMALVFGRLLTRKGVSNSIRVVLYSIAGVIGGLSAYSAYTIPNRSLDFLEATSLCVGMFVFCFTVNIAIVSVRSRFKQRTHNLKAEEKTDNWWRSRSRHFRKWTFLILLWVLASTLMLSAFDPLDHGSNMSDKELLEVILVVFFPLFVVMVRYAYRRLVD